jgi:hypothetical protein
LAATGEGSIRKVFFFEKRTKKLLSVGVPAGKCGRPRGNQKDKSFLLLFFKKEDLPSLPTQPLQTINTQRNLARTNHLVIECLAGPILWHAACLVAQQSRSTP